MTGTVDPAQRLGNRLNFLQLQKNLQGKSLPCIFILPSFYLCFVYDTIGASSSQ